MVFEGQGNRFLSADTTGSGTVIIDITGTLSMSSSNSYSGPTTLFAGTLQAGSTTAFSPNSAFTLVANAIPGAAQRQQGPLWI